MIDRLIIHPIGVGSAKLRLYPFSVDLAQQQLQITWAVLNNDEAVVNGGTLYLQGDDFVDYMAKDTTPDSLVKVLLPKLGYTLL